jgi:type IV pilus assembly protein PilY1
MRRGGDAYYALDVTDPDSPEVLWQKDSGDLPGLGQSWSGVTPTRIDVAGVTQNPHDLALVVGGGYDPSQDSAMTSIDGVGNSIYILDTLTGDLLWHGSADGGDQDFSTTDWSMDYSIPADVRVIDLNSDGYGDRLYAADMGGQIWRFDITNGNSASSLMAGGVIAQLGAGGQSSPPVENTRRFYYAPDIALVTNPSASFVHIGVGSGHRAHPNSTITHDEFYALRDYATFAPLTQTQYNNRTLIEPDDLVDVTTDVDASIPYGSAGWRLSLNDGGWRGEKVLAEARTFNGQLFVSTYRPNLSPTGCAPGLGTTRQYIMSLYNASPVNNLDGSVDDSSYELTDRYREYQGPPPPETVFFFPQPEVDLDGDGEIDEELSLACIAQGDCLGEISCQGLVCTENDEPRFPVRTFWNQVDID